MIDASFYTKYPNNNDAITLNGEYRFDSSNRRFRLIILFFLFRYL